MKVPEATGRQTAAGKEDTCVIRRLQVEQGSTGVGESRGAKTGIVLDVETTGIEFDDNAIIELAMRRFRFDAEGLIVEIDHVRSWLEDPVRPIPLEVTAITGLRDEDVRGRAIDEEIATAVLTSADIVIAHNSRFDRPLVERRLPGAQSLPWGCSMEQIDWRGAGFDGRQLGYLLFQAGWFHDGHRADADVDAVIQLLRHPLNDGRPALAELLARSARQSWMFRAVGADFGCKDMLRCRGYRWDSADRVWCKEIADEGRLQEEFWLSRSVYCSEARPRATGPAIEEITAQTRFL